MRRILSWLCIALLIATEFPATPNSSVAEAVNSNSPPSVGSCQIFPSNNAWNTDISGLPVHKNSVNYISSIGANGHLHADFWGGGSYGIPFTVVDKNQPKIPINFTAYGDESDPGPYPIPLNAPIEWGSASDGDRHVLAVDKDACMLYELYRAFPKSNAWDADSAAKFDLTSNALRPSGWTSADAAGLPIFPGLARYDEAANGTINHALRFTVAQTQKAFIAPATHFASSSTNPNLPPMGLRLRLKANYDISGFTGQSRIILNTLKKYGMIVADNGSNWYITGDANSGWNDDDLNALKTVPGSAFEAVDTTNISSVSTTTTTTSSTSTSGQLGNGITYSVDANSDRTPISPYIYGKNFWDGNTENLASSRLWGNRLTGYNWENNASNAGSDWNHSSDTYLGDTNVVWKVLTDFHDKNRSLWMSYSLVTLPMAGYVARDKNGSVWANEAAPSNRWDAVVPTKWSAFTMTPDLGDGKVYVDEEVNFLVSKYGKSNTANGVKGYSLDNEPALWPSTHPRIHSAKTTVKEMIDKSVATAKAVKSVDSTAEIFGPATYGFAENYHLQDAPDWTNYGQYSTYIEAYLANLKAASDTSGKRLLDVLDVHWYPEAQWVNASGGKTRITEDNNDAWVAGARMQAPRSLWDPTYTEDSWIGQWFASTAFPLIPKLKQSIETYYPGTKLAVTEFDYGGRNHVSGGIAQADVLGIFGKQGVYFATYWGDVSGYISSAYKLYRNYNGSNGAFGDTSIRATNPDTVNTSIYASTESANGKVHIVVLNKKTESLPIRINLSNITATSADIYGFDSSNSSVRKFITVTVAGNSLDYTMPATSAIHIVLNTVGGSVSGGSGSSSSSSGGGSSSSSSSSSSSGSGGGSSSGGTSSSSGGGTTTSHSITKISFHDIDNSFAKDDIKELAGRGVIGGYGDGTFRPNARISRAEFLKIVLAGLDIPVGQSETTPFLDVKSGWQVSVVERAAELDIISSEADYFRPNDPISRAEAVKILLKAAGFEWAGAGSHFSDISNEYSWSQAYIHQAYNLSIMKGQNGRFRPGDSITRAEAAKIVRKTWDIK